MWPASQECTNTLTRKGGDYSRDPTRVEPRPYPATSHPPLREVYSRHGRYVNMGVGEYPQNVTKIPCWGHGEGECRDRQRGATSSKTSGCGDRNEHKCELTNRRESGGRRRSGRGLTQYPVRCNAALPRYSLVGSAIDLPVPLEQVEWSFRRILSRA